MKITDRKIILFSLSLSSLSLAFFMYYRPDRPADDLLVVAKFNSVDKDVKRKMVNSLDWVNVSNNDEILSNDLLYTGSKSSAEISYLTKMLNVKMASNTILKIEIEDNNPSIDISSGAVFIEAGEKIYFNIRKDGKKHTLKIEGPTGINIPVEGRITYVNRTDANGKPIPQNSKNSGKQNSIETSTDFDSILSKVDPNVLNDKANNKKREDLVAFYLLIGFSLILFITSVFN